VRRRRYVQQSARHSGIKIFLEWCVQCPLDQHTLITARIEIPTQSRPAQRIYLTGVPMVDLLHNATVAEHIPDDEYLSGLVTSGYQFFGGMTRHHSEICQKFVADSENGKKLGFL
jgi:hypothetical protein